MTFICGENGAARATRAACTSPGPAWPTTVGPDEIVYLADGAVRLRVTESRGGAGEIDAVVEIGGSVASRQGLNIPGETAALPSVPDEDLEHVQTGERIGVDLVAVSFVRRASRHRDRARAHAAAADRQDREAAGGPARRGDRARRGLRDGRARRPRHRAAHRGGADRPEAGDRARRRARPAVDHRDADARLDGHLLAPDPRGGRRRGERHPRRDGRGDALPGERGRPVPRRRGVDDGGDRRADGDDRPVPGVERAPGAARPARPRLHASPTPPAARRTSSGSPRSCARRCPAAPRG